PRVRIHVGETDERADTGRVDQGVDAAETVGGLVERGSAGIGVGHVTRDGQRPRARLLGGPFESLLPAREQGRLRTTLGEPDADATPEPTRCSYDARAHCPSSDRTDGDVRQVWRWSTGSTLVGGCPLGPTGLIRWT